MMEWHSDSEPAIIAKTKYTRQLENIQSLDQQVFTLTFDSYNLVDSVSQRNCYETAEGEKTILYLRGW